MPPPVLDQHPAALYLYSGVLVALVVIVRALQSWSGFKGSAAVNIKFVFFIVLAVLAQVALKTGYLNFGGVEGVDAILLGQLPLFMIQIGRKPRKPLP